ncbi:MAG: membrane dipeptidase [Clostridia bacterium]|nr:membrane dipeptidase [Clostridia bacterium]
MLRLCDMHCDTAMAIWHGRQSLAKNTFNIDLEKASVFSKYLQLAAFFTSTKLGDEEGWEDFLASREYFLAECEKNRVPILYSGSEIRAWAESDAPIGFVLTVEDARILNGRLERVQQLYDLGIRVVTPLWGGDTCIGGSHNTEHGLTDFGREAVREMLRVGIVPDISHASFRSTDEILALCEEAGKPAVATHMNAFALHPHSRNLTDDRFLRLVKTGGVAGISLYVRHLAEEDPVTAEDVARHLLHYHALAPGHVGFGCDLDGADLPVGIADLSALPAIAQPLRAHGLDEQTIDDLYWGNVLRFLSSAIT